MTLYWSAATRIKKDDANTTRVRLVDRGNECYFLLRPNGYFFLGHKSHRGSDYSEQTLTAACAASAIISLLVGFLVGYLFTKKFSSKDLGPRCGHSYLEAQILER